MRAPHAATAFALLGSLAAVPGCATVVNGRTADVTLKTSPPNALVTVRDQDGTVVAQTTTPGQVELKRKGSGLKPARYTATFERPGYQPVRTELKSTLNPWLIGNIVLGGPIGLGVDAASGAMWRPKYRDVELPLAQLGQPYGEVQMTSATETATDMR